MADSTNLHPQNVKGQFFVDRNCIMCDHCNNIAPNHFYLDDERNSFVGRQPITAEEIAECEQAVSDCPVEAIGKLSQDEWRDLVLPKAEERESV